MANMKNKATNRLSSLFQTLRNRLPGDEIKIQDANIDSIVAKLPEELLIEIFRHLRTPRQSPKVIRPAFEDSLFQVSLVCRFWNNPATRAYYKVVQFPSVASVFRFRQALIEYPHLRRLVKTLILPARLRFSCPPSLMKVFVQIIHLLDSLEELTVTSHFVDDQRLQHNNPSRKFHMIPVEVGKHLAMDQLTLYGDGTRPANIQSTLAASFPQLTHLSLNGVNINDNVTPDTTPVLPQLNRFTCQSGNAAMRMDEWLCACPKLQRLSLCSMRCLSSSRYLDEAPLRVLRERKIKTLELYSMFARTRPYTGRWIAKCNSVTRLQITWDIFSCGPDALPSVLDRIELTVRRKDPVDLDAFRVHLERKPIWEEFVLFSSNRNPWYDENEEVLKKMFEDAGVPLRFDKSKVWYQTAAKPELKENRLVKRVKRVFKKGPTEEDELLDKWEWAKT
ncbi:hypothetical protein FRC14_007183 [Serendipita sp. 396]|nr:hypothetical protein FRC14_007183 [Serendipita sp. 396]KAG8778114.1 hypothetical protein FRC15_010963 [Serendipita sp. 397]KAG8794663.1 hypothetical protein FRC16_010410 [Serendipita sp. 398]KAG8811386.1 hypothetical protein FRC18_003538 [Serendipita sp. 400]KAG8819363.1 hypothetical protein FRC19_009843 [Serendipita sp. 401]KAG8849486.1 hypothetical protein FRB91_009853 [Serendipita sp. 411]KAG8863893.1 hypothetical protein FRC20_010483 [Serendipita sp. 405]KAG9052896.1 hypothetical prot